MHLKEHSVVLGLMCNRPETTTCVCLSVKLLSQPPLSYNRAPGIGKSTLWRKFNKPTRTTSGAKLRFLLMSILRTYDFRVQSFMWHNKTICSSERRGGASTGGEQTSRGGETSGGEGEEGDGREAGQGEGEESEGESSADRRGEVSPTHSSSSNTPQHLQESQPISCLSVCLRIRQRQRDEEEREREQQRQVRTQTHRHTCSKHQPQISEPASTALLLEDGGGSLETNITMKLIFSHQLFIHRLARLLQHLVSCVANSHLVLWAAWKAN